MESHLPLQFYFKHSHFTQANIAINTVFRCLFSSLWPSDVSSSSIVLQFCQNFELNANISVPPMLMLARYNVYSNHDYSVIQ